LLVNFPLISIPSSSALAVNSALVGSLTFSPVSGLPASGVALGFSCFISSKE